ncbi:MAG: lipopolysaccharide biosynthesis protein [Bacteroidota bacterium]
MEQVKNEISIQDMLFKFRDWLQYFLSKWKIILAISLLGAVLGLSYAVFKKTEYTAITTFVLEEDSPGGGGLGQYAGLAALVGIDIGGAANGIFQGDNITALYKSRLMIEKTLLTEAEFKGKNQLLIDYYVNFNGLRKKWNKKEKYANLHFSKVTGKPETRLADSLISEIVLDINKKYLKVGKPDKKLNLISVTFSAEDELFAKKFNNTIVATVNDFYIQTKSKKALDNIKVLQHQTDSVKAVMNGAINTAAQIVDLTPNLNASRQSQRSSPVQRSQFNAEANKAILTELVKNLELSKMNFLKNKPLIQVIDEPVFPLEDDKLGKVKMSVFGFFMAFLLSLFILVFREFFKKLAIPAN